MEKTTSLYAYFGELGIFDQDIPGHTFYQVGLLDQLSLTYGCSNFDFFNYADTNSTPPGRPLYPADQLGDVFRKHTDRLVNLYRMSFDQTLEKISDREYSKLFLKARFRNLATLQKKMRDAARFEKIINHALEVGYEPKDIIILDTDLSLPDSFLERISRIGIVRQIPSVTIPGIGKRFLTDCLALHKAASTNENHVLGSKLVYYGNLSFDNYKEGHSKNPIINSIIEQVDSVRKFDNSQFSMTVAAKKTNELTDKISELQNVELCGRHERERIWEAMGSALACVNVSKDLYLEKGFIPARVYESIIFGTIPVSYKKSHHPAMAFETVDDFFEICKFLSECSRADYYKILESIANQLC